MSKITWRRVPEQQARDLWADGNPVTLCPVHERPGVCSTKSTTIWPSSRYQTQALAHGCDSFSLMHEDWTTHHDETKAHFYVEGRINEAFNQIEALIEIGE